MILWIRLCHVRREATKRCELARAVEIVGNSPLKSHRISRCFASFLPCVSLSTSVSCKNSCWPLETPLFEVQSKVASPSFASCCPAHLMDASKARNYHKNPLRDLPSNSSSWEAGNTSSSPATPAGPRASPKLICPFPGV